MKVKSRTKSSSDLPSREMETFVMVIGMVDGVRLPNKNSLAVSLGV